MGTTRRLVGFLAGLAGAWLLVSTSAVAETAGRPVLVTVDDLPIASGGLHDDPAERARITLGLLDALERHGIRAVGLVVWSNVRSAEDTGLLERWIGAGHELGNHSYSHPDYTRTAAEAYIADVERGRSELQRFLEPRGRTVRFFRFPMLHEGNTPDKLRAMRDYLARSGQRNLPVTLDNQDWSFERPWVLARRSGDEAATRRIGEDYLASLRISIRHHERTGDRLLDRRLPQILLLHANSIGAEYWDRLFSWLESTGHRFVTADELLSDPVFEVRHEFVGPAGFGLWDRLGSAEREERAREEVEAHLDEQTAAWNRGDLERFCSGYEEDALFLTPGGITRGREEILTRYRRKYRDRESMGTLKLEILEIRPARGVEISMLGDSRPGGVHAVSVAARWTLSYPDREDSSGLTLMFLRRHGDGWSIAQDASM